MAKGIVMDEPLKAMAAANPTLGPSLQAAQAQCEAMGLNWANLIQNLPQVISLLGQFVTLLKSPPQ